MDSQNQQKWISIFDYSKASGLSISTVRRRIKDKKVIFKKQNGKFYILSQLPTNPQKNNEKMIQSLREENRKLRELLSEQSMLIELYEKKLDNRDVEITSQTGIWGNYSPEA